MIPGAKSMKRRTGLTLPLALMLAAAAGTQAAPARTFPSPEAVHRADMRAVTDTDRDRDGLAGPVRRVRTETVKLSNKGGKPVEGQRAVLESVTYDIKGNKTENAYFPVPGAVLTGKEVYKYDDKGNIAEMTLLNADGSLLSKEVYSYEFDQFGNWSKMTTSVAVIEGGKLSYETTEVTYRMLSYYLDEATLARMSQPAPSGAALPQQIASTSSPQVSKPAPNTAQPSMSAQNKVVAPLPSGGSLA